MAKQDNTRPNLPCLQMHISKMYRKELQSHLAKMERSTCEGSGSNKYRKPEWWPNNVPWSSHRINTRDQVTETLRKLVRNCYKYYGMEEMLKGKCHKSVRQDDKKSSRKPPSQPNEKVKVQSGTWESVSDPAIAADAPVPLSGPIPTKLFASLQESVIPTVAPVFGKMIEPAKSPIIPSGPKGYKNRMAKKLMSFVEIFVCYFCEKEFGGRNSLKSHQETCSMKPKHLDQMNSPVLTRLGFVRPPRIRRPLWCTNPVHPDDQVREQKNPFVEYLDLLPKNKMNTVKKKEEMVDCEDLDLEDNPIPKSPTTPRTKMSLLRQDSSPPACVTVRRSLTSSLSLTNKSKDEKEDKGPESDAESECSNGAKSEDSEDSAKLKRSAATRLLSIPITSELGHRVRKHVEAKKDIMGKQLTDGDKEIEISSNYEKYCHTPRKSEHYSRLRTRAEMDFPVTFNRRREISDFKCHKYKFTWKDHVEFWKTVKTGLNVRARKLKQKMRTCTVTLERLTDRDFKMWLVDYQQPKVLMTALSPAEIDKWSKKHNSDSYLIPMILDSPQYPKTPEHIPDEDLKRLLGLRNQHDVKVPLHERSLSLSQCVSEDVNAEVTQQKAVVYKTLLKAMDESEESALTPPDTPPDLTAESMEGVEPYETPKGNKHSSINGDVCPTVRKLLSTPNKELSPKGRDVPLDMEPITKLEPIVFYAGGKAAERNRKLNGDRRSAAKRWEASGGILVPLVQSALDKNPAEDFIVTLNDSSSSESPSPRSGQGMRKRRRVITVNPVEFTPRKNSLSSNGSDTSETASRENLPPRKVFPVKRGRPVKRKNKSTKVVHKPGSVQVAVRNKSKGKFTGKNSTNLSRVSKKVPAKKSTSKKKLPKQTKKGQRKGKSALKNMDESDEDNEVILSDRSSLASDSPTNADIDMLDSKPRGVKRKRTKKTGQTSSVASKKAKSNTPARKMSTDESRTIMFKCHLCGVELHAHLGDRDFIAEHYQDIHDVYNIRLRENVNSEGLRTVSVIQDVPKTPPCDEVQKWPFSPSKKPKSPVKQNGAKRPSPKKALNGKITKKPRGRPRIHKNGQTVKIVA